MHGSRAGGVVVRDVGIIKGWIIAQSEARREDGNRGKAQPNSGRVENTDGNRGKAQLELGRVDRTVGDWGKVQPSIMVRVDRTCCNGED